MPRPATHNTAIAAEVDRLLTERNARWPGKMNRTSLAEALGVSPSQLSQVLSGRRPASPEFVRRLAAVLHAPSGPLDRAAAADRGYLV